VFRFIFDRRDQEEADRQTLGLASIAVSLLLIVVSLFLFKHLQHIGHIEDCIMQGRTNCDILVPRLR
jgi:hypothetical protein